MTSIGRTSGKLDGGVPAGLVAERAAVLRGLVHALSNRVGTVASAAWLLAPDAPASPTAVGILQGEVERMEALLEEFRLLAGSAGGAGAEPIHLPDLVPAVVAIHAHHPELRDVPCEVVGLEALPPVLADPQATAGALLLVLAAVKRAGGGRLVLDGDADRVRVLGAPAAPNAATAEALAWLLGPAAVLDDGAGFALPTLAAGRRG